MENNKEQFTQIPHSLMSNKDLTDQDKLTLGLILSFINNEKECFMGNEYIAERLGITKNAASIRIKRLEKLGCISLRYTYKEGKNEVDKRYITLLSLTPKVSSDTQGVSSHRRDVSSDRQGGIVPETIGYRPADDGVSCKQGGIKQDLLNNVLNNLQDNLSDKVLYNENPVEVTLLKDKLSTMNLDENLHSAVISLIEGIPTKKQKLLISENKTIFNKIGVLQPLFQQFGI